MRTWMLAVLALTGCQLVEDVKDVIGGVTDPNVVIGIVGQVDPPTSDLIDLEALGLDLAPGRAGTVFLADARDVADLENAPVTEATLVVRGCGDGEIPFTNQDNGSYVLSVGTPLDDCAKASFTIARTDADKPTLAPVTIPEPPNVAVPAQIDSGVDLLLPLADAPFDAMLVIVADAETGNIIYSNEPEGISEYYQVLSGTQPIEDVLIPADDLPEQGVLAVIVTGLLRTPNRELTEANTVLSVVMGGRSRSYAVVVGEVPEEGG